MYRPSGSSHVGALLKTVLPPSGARDVLGANLRRVFPLSNDAAFADLLTALDGVDGLLAPENPRTL